QSAMSHSISIKKPLFLKKISKENGLEIYSCNGTSVDCVKLALNELRKGKKPDFLFSGINHGTNASVSIIYSGTMAAALEGSIHGITSIGLSVTDHSEDADFSIAQAWVPKIFENLMQNGVHNGLCLNINFPKIQLSEVKGLKVCRQARSRWVEEFDKRTDPFNRDYYWLTGKFHNYEPEATDTDDWALRNNYVSVVPVQFDFTNHSEINDLKIFEV
ncbi:MAG: 5'/3'-nucleotidase SurE, partial [Bacteroidota bacterium]|nr:5'/3'-nucleotidase SurE [Bacteroidota bacterium]